MIGTDKAVERLAIKTAEKISFVYANDIDYIKAASNYVEIFTGSRSQLLRTTMRELSERLPSDRFVRVSRSAIVNVTRITELQSRTHGDYLVTLQNGSSIIASRTYRGRLMQMLSLA